jgi:hypothetical protein
VAARKMGNHRGLPLQFLQITQVFLLFGCGFAALCLSVSNKAFYSANPKNSAAVVRMPPLKQSMARFSLGAWLFSSAFP